MSTIKHHAIVVTTYDYGIALRVKDKAEEIFKNKFNDPADRDVEDMITPIASGIANDLYSFMIAPDGSKEGWDTSNRADEAREEFVDYLRTVSCDFVEILFGGDNDREEIVSSNNKVAL